MNCHLRHSRQNVLFCPRLIKEIIPRCRHFLPLLSDPYFIILKLTIMRTNVKRMLTRSFAALTLCLATASLTAGYGGESFQIFLNNKLLLSQAAGRNISLKSLQLSRSNMNDELVIYYYHCNTPDRAGKGRSVSIKDANGKIVKEWKFADPSGSNTAMKIPVKELLQLSKEHPNNALSLYYMAQGRSEGQPLASL